jgi:hypothetical protein
LFVYRHNEAARACYAALGFVIAVCPESGPLIDQCYYMTRSVERTRTPTGG